MIDKLIAIYTKVFRFITHDIWHVDRETLSKRRAFWVRQLKVSIITIREFNQNKVNLQAASLTLFTLLSMVPIAALVFAVSKGFGIDEQLTNWLHGRFPNQHELVNWVLSFADSAIQNARGGVMAGVGLVILLWSSLNMLVQIEESFNSIWQAKRSRSWFRRFSDYLSIMLIAPVLLFISSSVTVTFKYYLASATESIPVLGEITPVIYKIVPFLSVWLLFTILYVVMPNIKVKIIPAMIAAVIAGSGFQLVEQFYLYSQVSISRYNAIYGSLAAIPLFLIATKIAWQIVLLGAELSFVFQNIDNYEQEEAQNEQINHRSMISFSLYILRHIVKNFEKGKPAQNSAQLAHDLSLSIRTANIILDQLLECGILVETIKGDDKNRFYQPSIDIQKLTISYVIDKLESLGAKLIAHDSTDDVQRINAILDHMKQIVAKEGGQTLLLEL